MAVCENFHVVGYNVLVGGGMGMTPARPDTFPALAQRLAFAWSGQVVEVVAGDPARSSATSATARTAGGPG